jgi:hypothetical protein
VVLGLALEMLLKAPDGVFAFVQASGGNDEGEAFERRTCCNEFVDQSAACREAEAAKQCQNLQPIRIAPAFTYWRL